MVSASLSISNCTEREWKFVSFQRTKRAKSGSFSGRPVNNWTRWTGSLRLSSFKSEIAGRFPSVLHFFFIWHQGNWLNDHDMRRRRKRYQKEWMLLRIRLAMSNTSLGCTWTVFGAALNWRIIRIGNKHCRNTHSHILGFQPILHPNPDTSPNPHLHGSSRVSIAKLKGRTILHWKLLNWRCKHACVLGLTRKKSEKTLT